MKKVLFVLICMCILLSGCKNGEPETAITYESVANLNEEAVKLYESGDYSSALTKYAEAISTNPTDMDSMIGAVQCQIALENYAMAGTNLSAAVRVDPADDRIYSLYVQMSEESDDINYAKTAVSLARTYHVTGFLDKVPDPPEISSPDGMYDSKFDVEISAPDGSHVFVSENKGSANTSYEYQKPITITRGDTSLEVYCVVDGIPSDTVNVKYVCDYPPIEVSFVDPVIEQLVRLNLGIASGPITDVDCENIKNIRQYDLQNNGMSWEEYAKISVDSLEDMKLFPNLQQLYIDNLGDITDFSSLALCKHLSFIDFSDGNMQDISFVKYIPNLEHCNLADNNITDLSPLTACEDLYGLYVEGNPIDSLEVLKDLDLENISVTAAYLKDFSILGNWENLDSLALYGCGGFDLAPLGDLDQLRSLYLYARDYSNDDWSFSPSPISDISFLSRLTELEDLNLDGLSDYDQIDIVKTLPDLTYLYIRTLDYTSLPDDIRQELQAALPKCSIN